MTRSIPIRAAVLRDTIAAAAAGLSILGALNLRLSALHYTFSTRRATDVATIPSPNAIRLLSLGHREWAADLLWSMEN